MLKILSPLDTDEMAAQRYGELRIPRDRAAELGRTAVEAMDQGYYFSPAGIKVDWSDSVNAAIRAKVSIPPDVSLAVVEPGQFPETLIQVANETTLGASRRLHENGSDPLALNFANGVHPGGGFLVGARAQEEVLCRSSALYRTLQNDPMYEAHSQRPLPDSTDWSILSPDVPVFRRDDGMELDHPWLLSFITCAAPYAPVIGQSVSRDLLQQRILRILAVARAYGYTSLVLGAWGCGAFGNDPYLTAEDFRMALENEFSGTFLEIVFAIADWSPERRFLRPFCQVFSSSFG